jgi:hypothetical protein
MRSVASDAGAQRNETTFVGYYSIKHHNKPGHKAQTVSVSSSMTTNSHSYSTTAIASTTALRWLHSPDPRQPESFMELHHLAYHHQPSMGDYCDDDPQPIPPTTPMVLTTPDLGGLTCAVVPAEAMTESPSPAAYVSRVEAPSFLPYNFAIPDHLLAKDKAQSATTPSGQAGLSEPQAPSLSPTSPEAVCVEQAESGSGFKVPQSVVSAVAAAASLAPASTTRGQAKKTKKAPRPKRPPAAPPRRGNAPRPTTATASGKPAMPIGGSPATSPQAIGESVPEVHNDDSTRQGWEKIMQTVDTQDAKLQRYPISCCAPGITW